MSRVFANGPGDWGSILGRVMPKTQKMALIASLLKTQHYKVRIKGKMEQSREWSLLDVVAIEKKSFGSRSSRVANFIYGIKYSNPIKYFAHSCMVSSNPTKYK